MSYHWSKKIGEQSAFNQSKTNDQIVAICFSKQNTRSNKPIILGNMLEMFED